MNDLPNDAPSSEHTASAEESVTAPSPEPLPLAGYQPEVPSSSDLAVEPASRTGVSVGGAIGISVVAALLVGTLAGGAAGIAGAWFATHGDNGPTSPSAPIALPADTNEPVTAAAAAALPSIVNIDVSGEPSATVDPSLPEGHPGVPFSGNGSGVAFKSADDGGTYILTNNHVVEKADSIVVTGTDRKKHTAELVGRDPETDVAVVKVDASLPVITLADSDEAVVGQLVVAIGSPYGLDLSVSSGVISAIGRSLPNSFGSDEGYYPLVDVIQTDAAINPGNSGGGLLDRAGRLLGINTAIYSESGSNDGIGFAIPTNTAIDIAEQLIVGGKAEHPFLGILGQNVTEDLAEQEQLTVDYGAWIVDVSPGTEAAKVGIRRGDVIIGLDEEEILSMDDLILQVRRRSVGDEVLVTLIREGKELEVDMKLGAKPDEVVFPEQPEQPELPELPTPDR